MCSKCQDRGYTIGSGRKGGSPNPCDQCGGYRPPLDGFSEFASPYPGLQELRVLLRNQEKIHQMLCEVLRRTAAT